MTHQPQPHHDAVKTETPRTDAETIKLLEPMDPVGTVVHVVPADFSRQLECENAALRSHADKMAEALRSLEGDHRTPWKELWSEQLAAYDAFTKQSNPNSK